MNVSKYLTTHRIDHELLRHRPAGSARETAELLNTPEEQVAKTVLLRAGDFAWVLAVLPADRRIDLARLARVLGGCQLRLASEEEVEARFDDCETGAVPPFGSHYGATTIVDHSLGRFEEMVFEGNTYRESYRVRFDDFLRMEGPIVTEFTTAPACSHREPFYRAARSA